MTPKPLKVTTTHPTEAEVRKANSQLRSWYHGHGRLDLPWRNTSDPYPIYISEVMLQQTQVATVLTRFYHPFLTQFPTLSALAEAELDEVLKAWEGLGYYTRARNLHQAAKQAAPALPNSIEALIQLPGIGKNTAHAIAAFAFHQPVPVMEANVKRILCRIFALSKPTEQQLWDYAYQLLDTAHPFDYNQAMMDIGALLCSKRNPVCTQCPLATICQGKTSPEHYPQANTKKKTPIRHKVIIVYEHEGAIYVNQRQSRFLGGLFGFSEYDKSAPPATSHMTALGEIRQIYSHFTLQATVFHHQLNNRPNDLFPTHGQWVAKEELTTLAFSKADSKVIEWLVAKP